MCCIRILFVFVLCACVCACVCAYVCALVDRVPGSIGAAKVLACLLAGIAPAGTGVWYIEYFFSSFMCSTAILYRAPPAPITFFAIYFLFCLCVQAYVRVYVYLYQRV